MIGVILGGIAERYLWLSVSRYGASWLLHPWVIAIGIFIVLTLVGVIRNLVAYVFSFAGVLFGAGSALALVMTAILFIFAVIFIFFGGNWIRAWIIRTKRNKWVLTAKKKGAKRGARITEGAETLETVAEGA